MVLVWRWSGTNSEMPYGSRLVGGLPARGLANSARGRESDVGAPEKGKGVGHAHGSSRHERPPIESLRGGRERSVFEGIDTRTPVLVLTASPRARRAPHTTLGILRSLGRLGVPVHTVDSNPRGPSSSSRYLRRRFIFDLPSASPEATVEHLSVLDTGSAPGPS